MSVEIRALRESERQECLDLWCTVWPGEGSPGYFRRYFYGDVDWLPYYTQVAVVDGRLVSAVQICKRTVACGDFRLTMGGIANVVTLPEYRGKGYNSACLQSAITVMEADAMDFSLLFTGINNYYARLGFTTLPRKQLSGTIPEGFAPRPTEYRVRPGNAEDMPAVRALYAAYNTKRPLAVQRSDAYWRDWITINLLFVATDPQGKVVGYLQCGTFRSAIPYAPEEVQVRVTEFGVERAQPTVQGEITEALFDAVAAHFLASGARKMRLDIAFDAPVRNALSGILEAQEWHNSTAGMVRLLHRENLLRSFVVELNERWVAAGRPPGSVSFATPYGAITLEGTGPLLRVHPAEETPGVLPQAALFTLLFEGVKQDPAEAATGDLFLRTLFPERAERMMYWGADGF